jgi:hypothetical protein
MNCPFIKLFQTLPSAFVPSFGCQKKETNEALLKTLATPRKHFEKCVLRDP